MLEDLASALLCLLFHISLYNHMHLYAYRKLDFYTILCSITHDDFNGLPLSYAVDSPSYVPSPYGAWLAISETPSLDSFSNWFRFVENTNYQFNETLILTGIASEGTHRLEGTHSCSRE